MSEQATRAALAALLRDEQALRVATRAVDDVVGCGAEEAGEIAFEVVRALADFVAAPAERTPEVVLRAMLVDAEKEALRVGVGEILGTSYPTSFRDAEDKATRIRRVLVAYLATGKLDLGGFNYGLCSQEREDYEARLRDGRSTNTPPLETP